MCLPSPPPPPPPHLYSNNRMKTCNLFNFNCNIFVYLCLSFSLSRFADIHGSTWTTNLTIQVSQKVARHPQLWLRPSKRNRRQLKPVRLTERGFSRTQKCTGPTRHMKISRSRHMWRQYLKKKGNSIEQRPNWEFRNTRQKKKKKKKGARGTIFCSMQDKNKIRKRYTMCKMEAAKNQAARKWNRSPEDKKKWTEEESI